MQQIPRARVVVVALALLALVVAVSSCRRACRTSDNCRRTCDCLNTATDTRNECGLAFVCEAGDGYCEEAYDAMSCDDLCAQYQANALCGVARCRTDADCHRALECDVLGLNGAPTGQKRACEITFACDVDNAACEVRSIASDTDLCAAECTNAAIGG
jgi:hypothetical protein